MTHEYDEDTLRDLVIEKVAGALELDPADIDRHASVIDDLGAESIDFLDIQFRIERHLDVRFETAQLYTPRFDVADPTWIVDGEITADGRRRLQAAAPDFPWDRFSGPIRLRDLPRLITVETIRHRLGTLLAARTEDSD